MVGHRRVITAAKPRTSLPNTAPFIGNLGGVSVSTNPLSRLSCYKSCCYCIFRSAVGFCQSNGLSRCGSILRTPWKNQYEDNRAVCVDQYCQRTDVCKCLHFIGRCKVMGQRYSGVHRSREGILQDGKSGEFFSDIVSFESSAGNRCAGLVLEIIVSHPHVPGRGSH